MTSASLSEIDHAAGFSKPPSSADVLFDKAFRGLTYAFTLATILLHKTKEAAFGMGATRWEAILKVMMPTAATGIFGALVLGFGRALGETMALAMLVGNANQISLSLFSPANTLAALLALNFPEAGELETPVLMYAACVLLLITLVVNIAGSLIMANTSSGAKR